MKRGKWGYFVTILEFALAAHAQEGGQTQIAAVVYTNPPGGIPSVCYYDLDKVVVAGDWNQGLLACETALIGKASTPTPKSPAEGFGVLHHDLLVRPGGYSCANFAQFTDGGAGLHCVINTPRRLDALKHPTRENTRVTHGCVNVATNGPFRKYYDRVIVIYVI